MIPTRLAPAATAVIGAAAAEQKEHQHDEEQEVQHVRFVPTGRIPQTDRMRRTLVVVAVAIMAVALPHPAAAAPTVAATIRVAEGYYPAAGTTAPYTYRSEPCAVNIPLRAATAYGLLVAARANRCISSFEADLQPTGHYLRCVEARCERLGFYWAIYLNGALTCAGVDAVPVKPKDEVAFSYEPYATALALATCELPPI